MTLRNEDSGTSWYLHFWPWFIAVLLGVSVLGSLVTVGIAYRYRDTEIPRRGPLADSSRDSVSVDASGPPVRDTGR